VQITIIDIMSWWGQKQIGSDPWPAESAAARAQRIMGLAGSPPQIGAPVVLATTLDPVTLAARDVDKQDTLALLQDLGGLLDAPLSYWATEHVLEMSSVDRRDDRGALSTHWPLDTCAVVTDWQPTRTVGDVINDVTFIWTDAGGNQQEAYASDAASIAAYGGRHLGTDTPLANGADAASLASLRVFRSAQPHWRLEALDIIGDRLAAASDRDVMRMLLAYTVGVYLAIGPIDPSQAPPFPLPGLIATNYVPGPELALNGDFHNGLAGFQTFWTNAVPGWTITSGVNGQATLTTDGTGADVGRIGTVAPLAVLPGQRYRLAHRVRANTPARADLAMISAPTAADADWFGGNGRIIQGKTVAAVPQGAWVTYVYEATVPDGHYFAALYWSALFNTPTNPGTVNMDDLSVMLLTQDIRLDVIAEGLTGTYDHTDGWQLQLAVSSRTQGWAVISWQDLQGASTANTKWSDVDPTLLWKNVSDISQFGG
jgi:hypothetical protein